MNTELFSLSGFAGAQLKWGPDISPMFATQDDIEINQQSLLSTQKSVSSQFFAGWFISTSRSTLPHSRVGKLSRHPISGVIKYTKNVIPRYDMEYLFL